MAQAPLQHTVTLSYLQAGLQVFKMDDRAVKQSDIVP